MRHASYGSAQDWLLLPGNQSDLGSACSFTPRIIACPAFISLLCISMYHNTVILTLVSVITPFIL
nr:MAG TPA: hypothetical protein [Caudoviricetes sp.]